MLRDRARRACHWSLVVLGLLSVVPGRDVHAQITLDGSLGPPQTLIGPNFTIDSTMGQIRGTNLFHSFGKFNVLQGESATFTNSLPSSIANVLSRVTGGERSFIDGLVRSNIAGANLYLINPSGVAFGPNASLNVSGAFHVSTADYLRLADGGMFYANLQNTSNLTIAPPAAFGFLSSTPAPISIQGSFLQVPNGQTLSVVGGDFTMTGGTLQAPSGAIRIASVGSQGEVIPNSPGQLPDLGVSSFTARAPVSLTGGANLDANGNGSGTVLIRGGKLSLQGNSVLQAITTGAVNGAPIAIDIDVTGALTANQTTIQAGTTAAGRSGDVRITAGSFTAENFSRFGQETVGSGDTGNFALTTGSLTMRQGGQIVVATGSSGASGNLIVTADNVLLSSTDNANRPAGLISGPATGAKGNGGDIRVTVAGKLELRDGGLIDTRTFGSGNSGLIEIKAGSILVTGTNARGGAASVTTRSVGTGGGNAGPVQIATGSLEVRGGGQITTTTGGPGVAGDIVINADRVLLTSVNAAGGSGPTTSISARGNVGAAGDVRITTGSLEVLDGATLTNSSTRSGAGGVIDITADRVLVSGVSPQGSRARITSQSDPPLATGPGGDVKITANSLEVRDGGLISVAAMGPGNSGNLILDAGTVLVSGQKSGFNFSAGLNASTQTSGKGGNIQITAGDLEVRDGAIIQAGTATSAATGDGGSIAVKADRVLVSGISPSGTVANITASTTQGSRGKGGNILIDAAALEVNQGQIGASTTGVGNAGSIQVSATDVTLVQGGLITTSTSGAGNAGSITLNVGTLTAQGDSQITSSSTGTGTGRGNAGSVTIQGLASPAQAVTLTDSSLRTSAAATGRGGSITVDATSVTLDNATISTSVKDFNAADATDSAAAGIGNIALTAPTLNMTGGTITAETSGTRNAGRITANVGTATLANNATVSSASTGGATGSAGSVTIQGLASPAQAVTLSNSSLRTSAAATGRGGSITVDATSVTLDKATISAAVKDFNAADATDSAAVGIGNIALTATTLNMTGGTVTAETSGTRNAGRITANVGTATLANNATVSSASTGGATGSAGSVTIQGLASPAQAVTLTNSSLRTSAAATGRGGSITVDATNVTLDNATISASVKDFNAVDTTDSAAVGMGNVALTAPTLNMTGGTVTAETSGTRNAGRITANVGTATLANGATVSSASTGGAAGNAGSVTIQGLASPAQDVTLSNSSLRTSAAATGRGGSITVDATSVTLDNATISASVKDFNAVGSTDSAAVGMGNIALTATTLNMTGGTVTAETSGTRNAGRITANVGTATLANGATVSSASTGGATGNAGSVTIQGLASPAEAVTLTNSSLRTSAAATGRGGSITVDATSLSLDSATISTSVKDFNAADSTDSAAVGMGNIALTAPTLNMTGGTVTAETSGTRNGGSITANVGTATLANNATVSSASTGGATGNAGSVTIQGLASPAEAVTLSNSSLRTSAAATGRGGSITVDATSVTLDNATISASVKDFNAVDATDSAAVGMGNIALTAPTLNMTGGTVTAETSGTRNAGRITANVGTATLANNATVSSASTGGATGNAGSVTIQGLASPAEAVTLTNSSLRTSTDGSGAGGAITMDAVTINLTNATVSAASTWDGNSGNLTPGNSTSSTAGKAGNVSISARDTVQIGASSVTTAAKQAEGGAINIAANKIQFDPDTLISASASGAGNAGSIAVVAGDTIVARNTTISTEATLSDGGNITLTAPTMVHLVDTKITTSVGTGQGKGGNITIDPQFVILDHSVLRADAFGGPGGNIRIFADVFLAQHSTLSASSALSAPGLIDIEARITDISGNVSRLPEGIAPVPALLRASCASRLAGGSISSLVVAGREGLPPDPEGLLPSPLLAVDAQVRAALSSSTMFPMAAANRPVLIASDCSGFRIP